MFWCSPARCMEASPSCPHSHAVGRCRVSVVITGARHPPTWTKGCCVIQRCCLLLSILPRREMSKTAFPSLKFSFLVFLILFNWCWAKRQEVVVQAAFFGQFFSLWQHEMSHVSPKSHPVTSKAQSARHWRACLRGGDFLPVGMWEHAGCESEGLKTCFWAGWKELGWDFPSVWKKKHASDDAEAASDADR